LPFDIFLSYKSEDRLWAERFHADVRKSFPWLRVFFDRTGIMAGANWRARLDSVMEECTHCVAFWSEAASASDEVRWEITHFKHVQQITPVYDHGQRTLFVFTLSGKVGGGLENIQGFPEAAKGYDTSLADRGIASIDTLPAAKEEWKRAVQMIGDAIGSQDARVPVPVAVLAMNERLVPTQNRRDPNFPDGGAPTLDEFLAAYGLTWESVKDRYGPRGLDWKPFGSPQNIVEMLETLRVEINSHLTSANHFRWDFLDMTIKPSWDRVTKVRDRPDPLILIVDPISLYQEDIAGGFKNMQKYLLDERSAVVSLAPLGHHDRDVLHEALRAQVRPLLDDYFKPVIPPAGNFALCSLNVQRVSEIERLVRRRIGIHRLEEETSRSKDLLMGRS
jgi:TIR domain